MFQYKVGPQWRWLVGQILFAFGQWIDKGALAKGIEAFTVDGYCKVLDGDKDAADAMTMGHAVGASGEDLNPVSLSKHAKALGLLKAACDLSERCASILKRYWVLIYPAAPNSLQFSTTVAFRHRRCVPLLVHSGPAMSISWWPAAHHRRMQGRILDRAALQILAALGEGAGLQEAGLQLGRCGSGWILRPCANSPKNPGGFLILPENSRRFFDLARKFPEIHRRRKYCKIHV